MEKKQYLCAQSKLKIFEQKMQSFWDYQEPLFGHKVVKKILKARNLRNYREAVANAK